jgi:hypothetical protein
MKRAVFAVFLALFAARGGAAFEGAPRPEKVSAHCYRLPTSKAGENAAAVVTEDGILMVNPPPKALLSTVLESLQTITPQTVRWVVFTSPRSLSDSGAALLAERGALFVSSVRLHKMLQPSSGAPPGPSGASGRSPEREGSASKDDFGWILFDRRMRLFPSSVEIRIFALSKSARTGEDIVLFLPEEKVLLVGDLFTAGRFPDIDTDSGGDAAGWIDGLQEVIGAVPLLKPAIPQVKPAAKTEQEKPLEESVRVVSASGNVSSLKDMKDLLEASQKLRSDVSRAARAGRTCDGFLASPASSPYRAFANLEAYARQLFRAVSGGY